MDLSGPKEVENAKPFILERLIQAKARQGKTDEAMNIAKRLIAETGGSWYFLQTQGQVEREAGKIDDAIKTYNEVLDKLDADKNLKGDEKDQLQGPRALHPQRAPRREQGDRQGREATPDARSSGTRTTPRTRTTSGSSGATTT